MKKSKKDNSEDKIFIVETISTFKIRYAIRGKSLKHAMDTVSCEEANELDQEFLGETIFGGRKVSKKEFLKNEFSIDYMKANPNVWTDEMKLDMIHNIDYSKEN